MADFYDWEKDKEDISKEPVKEPEKVEEPKEPQYNYFHIEPDYSDYDLSSSSDYDEELDDIYSSRKPKKEEKAKADKKTKITAICCLCAIILTSLFSVIYLGSIPKVQKSDTNITLEIVYANGEIDTLPISTTSKFLGDAIADAGYASTEDHSEDNYRTLNDVTVENGAKWVFARGNKELTLSVNKTPIDDGETYRATYTIPTETE